MRFLRLVEFKPFGPVRLLASCATLVAVTLLSACAGQAQGTSPAKQGAPATAAAPDPRTKSGGAFDDLLRTMNIKATVAPAPDFVSKSRPDNSELNYVPVGGQHPQRSYKVLSPAEVAATTANLDNLRETKQRKAGLKPAVVPDKKQKAPAGTAAATKP